MPQQHQRDNLWTISPIITGEPQSNQVRMGPDYLVNWIHFAERYCSPSSIATAVVLQRFEKSLSIQLLYSTEDKQTVGKSKISK